VWCRPGFLCDNEFDYDVSIRKRRRSMSRGSFFGEDIMSEEALQITFLLAWQEA
jgi:hypothetical protein